MTENEKKLVEAAVKWAMDGFPNENYRNNEVVAGLRNATRAVLLERLPIDGMRQAFRDYAVAHKNLPSQNMLGLQLWTELLEEAEKAIEAPATPAPGEGRGAMTPEKLKAYTGRDFDR